jgi:carboxymethylenebutenolidase
MSTAEASFPAPETMRVTADDCDMDMYVWRPPSGHGPGVLLIQEIFGVGVYLRGVAEKLAEMGYVVGAPDVFWRIERNFVTDHTEAGLQTAMGMMPKFVPQFGDGVADCVRALHALGEREDVTGSPGVLGFCLGGSLAWLVAAQAEPSVCVSYYGSVVPDQADAAAAISCPTLLHFGDADAFIANEKVEALRAAIADRPNMSLHVWSAGHAFDNFDAPMFFDETAAAAAWTVTSAFLAEHLPA